MSIDLSPPTPLWARARSEALQDTHAMAIAREWVASDAWALLLLGAVGRGKSQAAAWLWLRLRHLDLLDADHHHRLRRGVLWLRARVLQRLDWQTRAATLSRCAGAYGLVVDELGGEDEKTSEALSDILEQRGDEGRRTVLTSNLEPAAFAARYGDRLISRLRAGGITDKGSARWAAVVRGGDLRGSDVEPVPEDEQRDDEAPVTPEQQAAILAEHAPEVAHLIHIARRPVCADREVGRTGEGGPTRRDGGVM